MKLIDGKSNLGQKLDKWLFQGQNESPGQDHNTSEKSKPIRNQLPSADEPETELEKKIRKWFTAAEEVDRPIIIEEKFSPNRHQILVMTYYRAILFETGYFRKLKDISDKVWRQFVSVHLAEKTFYSALDLRFFPYHDSISYHNPYKEHSSLQESDFQTWHLDNLNKEEARKVYSFLKDKELYWQETRRKEQAEQYRMLQAKLPGGVPPAKKG
jgi:hypothetical protein